MRHPETSGLKRKYHAPIFWRSQGDREGRIQVGWSKSALSPNNPHQPPGSQVVPAVPAWYSLMITVFPEGRGCPGRTTLAWPAGLGRASSADLSQDQPGDGTRRPSMRVRPRVLSDLTVAHMVKRPGSPGKSHTPFPGLEHRSELGGHPTSLSDLPEPYGNADNSCDVEVLTCFLILMPRAYTPKLPFRELKTAEITANWRQTRANYSSLYENTSAVAVEAIQVSEEAH
ncbi:hypothetical protein KIN20_025229 [Parelaphostrongylus tenuis]|uniref:Uncharacterized protein n=1 Tax=Parelaphostrongylus tenuis TaxID=148309 RepID=A0AAD5QXR1_PARTN|nr:hypothetical protein KIN20_025229 [Parelaphostrongylus tenuis]